MTMMLALSMTVQAQSDTIRYVKTTGSYTNNGRSWSNAKSDLQSAINDLKEYLDEYGLTSGSIYVAAGIYKPTETTEAEGGGLQYTAFKIYPGIHIYGGFRADESDMDAKPYNADGTPDETYRPIDHTLTSLESGQAAKPQPWNFVNKTVLSGSHYSEPTFTYEQDHGTFSTVFPGNSYHVVWFATEGFIPVTVEGDQAVHALPLSSPASVDGCRITGGNAASKTTTERLHTAYGGGAYLVANATLSRCVVDHCEAVMRGGGVYLDGGGLVDKCFINTCQSPGVGIMQGYGGGVCIDYDGAVTRSYIVNNSSRIGGGVAICHAPDEYPWQSLDAWRVANGGTAQGEINVYSPHATACIISNNTTTAEGGGIYFYDGGVGNHLTVTRNNCVGKDITYYGRRHGRSGGVYVLNGGQIYNSVFWGNKCAANSDIQYASHTSGSTDDVVDPVTGEVTKEGLKPKFYYSAIEKHDITDWAGTGKQNVMSLESTNTNAEGTYANYPYFIGSDGRGTLTDVHGAGLNTIPRPIYWKPAAITSMAKKGLQVTDALHLTSKWIEHAHTETDLFLDTYEPMSTFGALTRRDEQIGCVMVPNQEIALYRDQGYTQAQVDAYNSAVVADAQNPEIVLPTQLPDDGLQPSLPTIFVDPSRNAGAAGIRIGQQNIGASWTYPVAHINDAIHFFRQRQWAKGTTKEGNPMDFWYNIGGTKNPDGSFTGGDDYPYVQILVKGFERGSDIYATTAGLDAYLGTQLRTAAIRPASNMRIYGGYLPTSTGTDASQRNARTYPSMITANITNTGYENNSAHVLALINVKNVIIDGLRLNEGNANLNENHSYAPIDPATGNPYPINFGGGLVMNNRSVPQSERIDMTGNILRNSYIANCSAPEGAAIYVNSSNKKEDGTYSKAQLNIINTIIRNNTVGDGTHDISDPSFGDAGVITACGGEALIRLDHCDIVNNCGFALETLEYTDKTTPTAFNANGINEDEGQIRIYNSVIYANGKTDRSNRKNITHPLSCRSRSNSQNNVDGDYIFLDWDAPKPKNPAHCYATLCRDMSDQYQKWAIRKMDINQQTIIEKDVSPQYFDTQAEAEAYITAHPAPGIDYATGTGWEWGHLQGSSSAGPILLEYPFFENPSKNVGHSAEGDKPMNGGVVSYMPQNKNPMVNAAVSASRRLWDSDNLVRTRGGDPDIGAIEDRSLPEDGAVLYVTQDGAGRMDGSSWANAIAGNLVYRIGDSYVVDNVNGDGTNHTVTTKNNLYRGGYAVDYVYKTGSTTYVDRQTVTQKRINLTYDADGNLITTEEAGTTTLATAENTQTITESNTLTRQPTEFIYGEKSGASRNFYRTNLKDSQIPIVTQANNGYKDVDIDNALAITNNRSEDYVSGLQFAVEKAAALNKGKAVADRVQVWVGNGTYEDYKGFVMRDRVEVLGGFPATKYSTPGMSERHALVSEYVPLSELNAALEEEKDQYETTLQIIDKKPFNDDTWGFNSEVVLYKDKDYTENGNKTITTETAVTVPVYYRRDALPAGGYSDYYEIQGGNVLTDCTDKILNPSFEQNAGTGVWKDSKAGNGWSISKGSLSLKPGSGDYTAVHGAGVKNNTGGYEVYQDIYNLEEGFYRVSCQGFNQQNAAGKISLFANGEQRVLMNVIGSNVDPMQDGVAQLAQGLYDNNWVDVFVGANGHLRIGVKGNYTGSGLTMFDNFRLERLSGSEVASSSITTSKETGYVDKAFSKEYSTFRKPVLSMPDVCMTTLWPGRLVAANESTNDNKSNEGRWELADGIYRGKSGTGMEVYTDAHWDGFTIRNGFIYDYLANRDGGAGVRMFEGGTLENCVVVDNTVIWTARGRGGGGYCDGRTSKVIGCFFVNNLNSGIRHATPTSSNDIDNNGGGIYLLVGTCYNSLFANNVCWGNDSRGAGIYIEQATFYNNTVAYNTCRKRDLTINTAKGTGVHQYEGINNGATLNVFNTIFYKNTGKAIGSQNESLLSQFKNCYIQSNNGLSSTIQGKFLNCKYGTSLDNPFEKGDEAPTLNNFRLVNSSWCINKGINLDELLDTYPDKDVDFAARVQDCQIDIGAYEYDGTQEIQPGYELIAFDPEAPETRELCAVYYVDDGGNGLATGQSPDNAACRMKLQHILDAAGRLKMDLAAIKAGTFNNTKRYSTQAVNLTSNVSATYEEISIEGGEKKVEQVTVKNNQLKNVKHVIVKVAEGTYYPIRSTNQKMVQGLAEEVLPTRSLTIPHGVEVMGGYLPYGDEHPFYETYRDPLNHKTVFSGQVEDTNTGNYGRAYHVVTFTNDLFGTHDLIFTKKVSESETLSGENALVSIADRAVIDGIAIEDGMASGTDDEDKGGGAAVVTDFSHVRNCIIQDNDATLHGGGLYLQPGALVSGCVMLNNEADYGGAVYVEEPGDEQMATYTTDELRNAAYARLYNSTIVRNTASVRGGGIWYETNIRAKGVCLWWNSSNDMNNVAGVFDTEKLMTEGNYPFAYSAVQSRRLPGVNNIELKPEADLGVRWTPFYNDDRDNDMRWRGDKPSYTSQENKDAYYYITRLSMLIRSGMPYNLYKTLRGTYPSLELRDMAGVARMREVYDENVDAGETVEGHTNISYLKHMTLVPEAKDNEFIEIGARVLNNQAGAKLERPFTRLYVVSPEFVDNDVAYRLLTCADPLYSQQGSSMANPFQKLTDALDYIIKLRSSDILASHSMTFANADAFNAAKSVMTLYTSSGEEASSWTNASTPYYRKLKDIYCDTRFEVFLSGGTYYPYHNTHGVEGHARSSTFVIPEGVTVVGGLDPDVYYCQDGYNFPYLQPMAGDEILNYYGNEHPDLYSSANDAVDVRSNARTTFLNESNVEIDGLSDIELVAAIPKTIWENRPLADINGNNVFEPWEFQNATVLSGNTSRGYEALDNVYHVITCFADPNYVGLLPKRYSSYDENAGQLRFSGKLLETREGTENSTSEMHRTIILSGVTVADGNARDYDSDAVTNRSQYYRGGGIMVDGSWTDGDGNSGQTDPDEKGNRNIPFYIIGSQFQNNNAIQGGAIFTNGTMNIFSCSFVQNYAQGPTAHPTQTAADKATGQSTIQYNGGGAIASNDVLRCVNSIFANNEAMLGDWSDKMESTAKGWDIQGFGGAIWGGEKSQVRLMNCDIVMNKAVSYPSVFVNPSDPKDYTDPDDPTFNGMNNRFCVNTIYWGNKTTGLTDAKKSEGFSALLAGKPDDKTEEVYLDINNDVFSYRTQENKEIELDIVDKYNRGETLTTEEAAQIAEFSKAQPMFFCAYRPGFGPTPVRTSDNVSSSPYVADGKVTIHDITRTGFDQYNGNSYDPHEVPFLGETLEGDLTYFDVFVGNNNINITFENEGVNGPNFVLPSTEPGKDGYNPSANWMISRVNNLIDNGWSYLTLTSKTVTGDIEFKQIPTSGYNSANNTGGTPPETPMTPPYDGISSGPYHFYAWQQSILYKLTLMPFGDQHYMRYKNTNMTDEVTNGQSNMLRISSNPLTFDEAKAYIDLGVYEYQHRNLRINQSSEIDLLWVSPNENFEKGNDGYTWQTPTSNLQAAIETLMKSRNDHAKQINIIGGEYKPAAVLGDEQDRSLSFTIQTRPYNNAAFTPKTGQDYGIRSLTLRGGYDPEIPGEQGYDFTKNKVILSVEESTSTTANQLNHVVNILDAEQYTTTVNETDPNPESVSRGVAIPIIFEGITFNNELANAYDGDPAHTDTYNKGGASIYYHKQYQYDDVNKRKSTTELLKPPAKCTPSYTSVYIDPATGEVVDSSTPGAVSAEQVSWTWDWTQSSNEPKLTLRNCTFTRNGKDVSSPTSAVLIEGGGGEALVINSLFERNAGDPLVAVNTKVVNSTFGLNGGHLTLSETTENGTAYHSELHNSVIWHDDQNNATPITKDNPGTQYYGVSSGTYMTNNAITGLSDAEDANHNCGLSDINGDVMTGPNFTDPQHGDFSLNPSKKLMNTGHNRTYAKFAWPDYIDPSDASLDPDVTIDGNTMKAYLALMKNLHPDQRTPVTRTTIIRVGTENKSVTYSILKATDDHDLIFVDRLIGSDIDRGAFECSISGQRVIYVNMNKTPLGTETGTSWEKAYGRGQLQKAIDAATIYATSAIKKAYVFVQGTPGTTNEESLTIRDGVDLYGSIQNSSTMQAIPKSEVALDGALQYTEKEIEVFVNRVKAERLGMAGSTTNRTTIRGVTSIASSFAQGAVIDGFVISNRATTADPATAPAVDIKVPNVAVRNCIITDNVMTGSSSSVVNMEGGASASERSLLYNTLLYGNTASAGQPLINVGSNGYVLNCTVVSNNDGETKISGTGSSNVSNTIEADESSERGAMFAPYMRPDANDAYTPPSYITENQPYWYQLHEQSKEINAGTDNGSTPKNGGNTVAVLFPNFVNFDLDRDILGNPRRLGGHVDNGCYETWKVSDSRYATNVTNPKPDLIHPVADLETSDPGYDSEYGTTTMVAKGDYWTTNYGGHLYPHRGSVVYVENGGVLSFDQAETTHTGSVIAPHKGGTALFNSESPIRPGYLLVKEGGSVYGNGNTLQAAYVAVERNFVADQKYALMSTPFPADIQNITTSTYAGTSTDQLTQDNRYTDLKAYSYDSEGRANYRYHPVTSGTDGSELWKARSSSVVDANEGWLLEWNTAPDEATTVRLTGWGETNGSYVYSEDGSDKTVMLQQYDNRTSAKDPAMFTALENMGWNLKGMPWLISDYKTGGSNPNFEMDVPHMLYKMNGSGGYASLASWESTTSLSPGEAFFTQTAIIGSEETLTFKQPYYTETTTAAVKGDQLTIDFWNEDGETDAVALKPTEDANDAMAYTLNVDAVKWGALNPNLPQLWVENQGGTPFALSGHTPTGRRLPLGVTAPTEGSYTFQLRDANEAAINVWLIDEAENKVVDLTNETYRFNGTSDATGRFFLQLGGTRPQLGDLPSDHQYKVYVRDRVIHVLGTQVGDHILVYLPDGALYISDDAVDGHWRGPVQRQGIYVVRVNNETHKVTAK